MKTLEKFRVPLEATLFTPRGTHFTVEPLF